jgi:hypothetical protein
MTNFRLIPGPLFAVLLPILACDASTGSVAGIVDDPREGHLGASGASVVLLRDGKPSHRTQTDEKGTYRLEGVPAGHDYTVVVRRDEPEGFEELTRVGVEVQAGRETILNIGPEGLRRARPKADSRPGPEQSERIAKLQALGYLSGYEPATDREMIAHFDRSSAHLGFNFYVSGHATAAYLRDMEGKLLHEWSYDQDIAWPKGKDRVLLDRLHRRFWRRAHLFPNGDLLAVYDGSGIVKLDRSSQLLWVNANGAHHDVDVSSDGSIYVLTRKAHVNPEINATKPVLEDFIEVLGPGGETRERVSLWEAFQRSQYRHFLPRRRAGDIFHTNTVEVFDGTMSSRSPLFAEGNVLVSIPMLDAIAIVDLERRKVAWATKGDWKFQHQPTLLDNGHILLFDNQGARGESSRVLEFDPLTMVQSWLYRGDRAESFYSRFNGSNQRLANGNTLITESDSGRAFEVTPAGRIVWEFNNPHRAGRDDELVATLFELIRVAPSYLAPMQLEPGEPPRAPVASTDAVDPTSR